MQSNTLIAVVASTGTRLQHGAARKSRKQVSETFVVLCLVLLSACAENEQAPQTPTAATGVREDPSHGTFDRGAAAKALGDAANRAQDCWAPGRPTGSGHVKVSYAPSGAVARVVVDPPFAGTELESCFVDAFTQASVPPFDGAGITVGKSLEIRPIAK